MPFCAKKEKAPKKKASEAEEKDAAAKSKKASKSDKKSNDKAPSTTDPVQAEEVSEKIVETKPKKDKADKKKNKREPKVAVSGNSEADVASGESTAENGSAKASLKLDTKKAHKKDKTAANEEHAESGNKGGEVEELNHATSASPRSEASEKEKKKDKESKKDRNKEDKTPRTPKIAEPVVEEKADSGAKSAPKSPRFAVEDEIVPASPRITGEESTKSPRKSARSEDKSAEERTPSPATPTVTTDEDIATTTTTTTVNDSALATGRRTPRTQEVPSSEKLPSRHAYAASAGGHGFNDPLLSPKAARPRPASQRPNPFNRGASAFAGSSVPTTPRSARAPYMRSLGRQRSSTMSTSEWNQIQDKAEEVVSIQRESINRRQTLLKNQASNIALVAQQEIERAKQSDVVATLDDLDDLERALDSEVMSIASFRPEDYNEEALTQVVMEQAIKEHLEKDIEETKRVLEAMEEEDSLDLDDLEGLGDDLDFGDSDSMNEDDFLDHAEPTSEAPASETPTKVKKSKKEKKAKQKQQETLADSITESTHTDRTHHRTSSAHSELDSISNSARSVDPVA